MLLSSTERGHWCGALMAQRPVAPYAADIFNRPDASENATFHRCVGCEIPQPRPPA